MITRNRGFSLTNVRRTSVLTIAGLLLVFLTSTASSQERRSEARNSGPKPLLLPNQVVLSQIHELPGSDQLLSQLTGKNGLIVWPKSMWVGTTFDPNSYESNESESIKYLVLHLAIGNNSSSDLHLKSGDIRLAVQGQELIANQLPKAAGTVFSVDGSEKDMSDLLLPGELKIPAGKSLWFWCAFAPLPRMPHVPDMILSIGEEPVRVDLNQLAGRVLNLEKKVVGPRNSLLLAHVRGHLDTVSARNLAESLSEEVRRGVMRVVIYWEKNAHPVDTSVVEWLLESGAPAENRELVLQGRPRLPELKSLQLAGIPISVGDLDYLEGWSRVHQAPEDAVAAALNDLLPWASQAEIHEQLTAGHPWVSRAIQRDSRVRLTSAVWPVIRRQLTSQSKEEQVTAIAALARLNTPDALSELERVVRTSSTEELRSAALYGLVQSTNPEARQRVQQILESGAVPLEAWVITLLSESSQNQFGNWILQGLSSTDADVRVAALEGMDRIGSEGLSARTIEFLKDEDLKVRQAAFGILVSLEEPEATRAAVEYALTAIHDVDLEESGVELIRKTRDPRFSAPLLKLIKERIPAGDNTGLIELVGLVGDVQTADELARLVPQMSASDQYNVLEQMQSWNLDLAVRISLNALSSTDSDLLMMAFQILRDFGDEQAIRKVVARFESADADTQEFLVELLGETNSRVAHEALIRMRDQAYEKKDFQRLATALEVLYSTRQFSPGWGCAERGYYRLQEEELEEAIRCFELAVEIDPELASAYSSAGNAYLKLDRIEEAMRSYDQAVKLDPFDDQAITGLGIAMSRQGKPEEAVKLVLEMADRCPDNYVFEYNVGCVYGRAVENLKTRPVSAERDTLIQKYSEEGISRVRRSITLGFDDYALIESDPDIDALRDHPKFGRWNDE